MEPKPFSDEELEVLSKAGWPFVDSFLATIDADRKRIEELENLRPHDADISTGQMDAYNRLKQQIADLKAENGLLRERFDAMVTANPNTAELVAQNEKLRAENEQLQVQLAGCSVAALGGTKDTAKKGDYGWSVSYQDVLELRLKYEAALGGQPDGEKEGK